MIAAPGPAGECGGRVSTQRALAGVWAAPDVERWRGAATDGGDAQKDGQGSSDPASQWCARVVIEAPMYVNQPHRRHLLTRRKPQRPHDVGVVQLHAQRRLQLLLRCCLRWAAGGLVLDDLAQTGGQGGLRVQSGMSVHSEHSHSRSAPCPAAAVHTSRAPARLVLHQREGPGNLKFRGTVLCAAVGLVAPPFLAARVATCMSEDDCTRGGSIDTTA